jgi:hypothetical protein
VWTCCGSTYPVDEKSMTFWCQVYMAREHFRSR